MTKYKITDKDTSETTVSEIIGTSTKDGLLCLYSKEGEEYFNIETIRKVTIIREEDSDKDS